MLARRGLAAVWTKAVALGVAQVRLRLRRLGVGPSTFGSLEELALAYRAGAFRCEQVNAPYSLQRIQAFAPDLIVVANFSRILKPKLIAIPSLGCINVHVSLLPKYRGPTPHYWVLRNGETTTGVTVHYVDPGIDSGDIILQREMTITPDDTELTLQNRSALLGADALVEAIRLIEAGTAPRCKQDSRRATYYSFPSRGSSRHRLLNVLRKASGTYYSFPPRSSSRL